VIDAGERAAEGSCTSQRTSGDSVLVIGGGFLAIALAYQLAQAGTAEVWLLPQRVSESVGSTGVAGAALWLAPDDAEFEDRVSLAEDSLRFVEDLSVPARRGIGLREGLARAQIDGSVWIERRAHLLSPAAFSAFLWDRARALGARVYSGCPDLFGGRQRVWATGACIQNGGLAEGERLRWLRAWIGTTASFAFGLRISWVDSVYYIQRGSRIVAGEFSTPAAPPSEDLPANSPLHRHALPGSIRWYRGGVWPEIYAKVGYPELVHVGARLYFRGGSGSGIRYGLGAARRAVLRLGLR